MSKQDLMFYEAYESFYKMTSSSKAFSAFCNEAFGGDLSQDGFSDISQVDMILRYIPDKSDVAILDIGCGNGKMLGYLQKKTDAVVYGFDYSEIAIEEAEGSFTSNAEFRVGVIGETDYPENSFDVITSMDSIYFAKDMSAFVMQVLHWLRPDGVFFVGYQEGDVIPKTESADNAMLTKILKENNIPFTCTDITPQVYDLLLKKRNTALKYKSEFIREGHKEWFDLLMMQTEYASVSFEEFKDKMSRYIYVIRKPRQ